jgi:hypothetical protein
LAEEAIDTNARRQHRIEVLSTILLAVAAVATAWSTYQSTRWRGESTADYSKGTAARIESSSASTRAGQLTQIDIATFIQWVDASVGGKPQLAQFYRRRFRTEFSPAFAAWLATHPRSNRAAPQTPFAMPQYRVGQATEAKRLNAEAGGHANDAGTANERSDNYVLAVVLFAVSLFFAGVSTKLHGLRQREVLLALGWLIFSGTVVWVATFPINFAV